MKLVVFCEAHADFRLASGLFDRVHCEHGPDWIAATMETPEAIRTWVKDPADRQYFNVDKLNEYTARFPIPSIRGHFDGKPGSANAMMARKAFALAHALRKYGSDGAPVDAVILVGDADHQRDERREGLAQAKAEANRLYAFAIACGLSYPEREAWILAGFAPSSDDEHQSLRELREELSLDPLCEAAKLRDKQPGALRDIKRVTTRLINNDLDREARCWTEPSLDTLRERGADSGLAAFLDELVHVVNHLHPDAARPRSS